MFMKLPPDRPNSAGSVPVCSLNSATASTDGTHCEMFTPRLTLTVLATPSTETSPDAIGDPLAEYETLVIVSLARVSSPYRLFTTPAASVNMKRLECPLRGRLSMISLRMTDPREEDSVCNGETLPVTVTVSE